MSNSLNQDHDRHFVRPDLGPNWLQRLSVNIADNISRHYQGRIQACEYFIILSTLKNALIKKGLLFSYKHINLSCKILQLQKSESFLLQFKVSLWPQVSSNEYLKFKFLLQNHIIVISIYTFPLYGLRLDGQYNYFFSLHKMTIYLIFLSEKFCCRSHWKHLIKCKWVIKVQNFQNPEL